MLIRYRVNSACTIDNFKTDINNIIVGNIITVNDLSAGADKANSIMYGTYPAGTYARANNTTFTYSKDHNTEAKTHYFRLNFTATGIDQLTLAESYTSGTDTLLNSATFSTSILFNNPYTTINPVGFDIIVSDKLFNIVPSGQMEKVGVYDIGHNAVTRAYANTMLMVTGDMGDYNNPKAGLYTYIPYTYFFDTLSYASDMTGQPANAVSTMRKTTGNSVAVIFESAFTTGVTGAPSLMYGTFRIPAFTFEGQQIYRDASNNYRLTFNDISFLVD